MKHIEERLYAKDEKSVNDQSMMGQTSRIQNKQYGALLPKTGVYFLPDEKIVGFLK
jgi:hypothetical protein